MYNYTKKEVKNLRYFKELREIGNKLIVSHEKITLIISDMKVSVYYNKTNSIRTAISKLLEKIDAKYQNIPSMSITTDLISIMRNNRIMLILI